MASTIINYISLFIILIIVLFSYCHISKLKTLNNELKILQTVDPDFDIVFNLLEKHQPIVLQKEIFYWKEFNNLIGESLVNINVLEPTKILKCRSCDKINHMITTDDSKELKDKMVIALLQKPLSKYKSESCFYKTCLLNK